ncbi:MAG: hypothetical protein IKA64_03795 [Clostridia bacterium]|nr:hypothetical protein [Clostridia bacterium]
MDNNENYQGGSEVSPKTRLTFEVTDKAEGAGLVFDSEDKKPSASRGPEITPPEEEFVVPDVFTAAEVSEGYAPAPQPLHMRTTYVPRFTETSEKYRQPRGGTEKPEAEVKLVTDTEPVATPTAEDRPDPTAELDGTGSPETLVVVSGAATDASALVDESINIFKFIPEEEPEQTPLPEEPAVQPEPEAEEEPEEVETPVTEEQPTEPVAEPEPAAPAWQLIEYAPEEDSGADGPLSASPMVKKARRSEFISTVQRDDIKDRFLDTILSVKVRLIAAAVLLFVTLVIGSLSLFGIRLSALMGLGAVFGADAVIELQLCICFTLLALPELISAVAAIFTRRLRPELLLIVSLLVMILYTSVTVTSGAMSYPLFGTVFGVQALSVILGAFYRKRADYTAFRTVSRNTVKSVIENRPTRELERENMALDGVIDEYKSKTSRVFRTAFVSDFFSHVGSFCENTGNVLLLLIAGLGISLVAGAAAFFISGMSASVGVQAMALVFMLATPSFSVLIHKLPLYRLSIEAGGESGAFIGEEAVLDCAGVDVITYRDTEIFGEEDVTVKKVYLYGKAYNTAKAMKQMYSLFSVVGGPLERLFTAALDRKCPQAEGVSIEDDGVVGIFEGKTVHAGSLEYMRRHGVRIPDDDHRVGSATTDSTRVLYGAEDGEVYVKFFIRYSFSEEFTMLLPIFKEQGITPLVYTRDPNINNELFMLLTMGEEQIRVMKKRSLPGTEDKVYRRVSGATVTLGNKAEAVNLILLSKRYEAFMNTLSVMELVAMIVGAALGVLLSVMGMLAVPAPALALWQAAWCLALYILSARSFGLQKRSSFDEE